MAPKTIVVPLSSVPAAKPPATLLVTAARRHTALERVALGSTTTGVLNAVTCPVLVIPLGNG